MKEKLLNALRKGWEKAGVGLKTSAKVFVVAAVAALLSDLGVKIELVQKLLQAAGF